jgi:hypothetical protein
MEDDYDNQRSSMQIPVILEHFLSPCHFLFILCLISFYAYSTYRQTKMNSNEVIENMDLVKEAFVAPPPKHDNSHGSLMSSSVVTGDHFQQLVRTVGLTVGAVGAAAAMNFHMTLPFR